MRIPGVGADRLADAVAVKTLYGVPACVVDFGTATTFDAINARGQYLGGAHCSRHWNCCRCIDATHFQMPTVELKRHALGHWQQYAARHAVRAAFRVCFPRRRDGRAVFGGELGDQMKVIATGGLG